jgi:hypothetical protein
MARWYATFNNATDSYLESSAYRAQRKAMTSGATRKSNLLSLRAALSAGWAANVNAANRDGALGIVVPANGYTRSGGNFAGTNLYTKADAQWPSDPKVRPTAQILIANSTPLGTADPYTFSETLYTDAQTELESLLSDVALRSRLGPNPWRTLASLWHDHAFTYFAWDDFLPGIPQSVSGFSSGGPNVDPVIVQYSWAAQYPHDVDGMAQISGDLYNVTTGSPAASFGPILVPAGDLGYNWNIPGGTLDPGTHNGTFTIRFRDEVITTHFGSSQGAVIANFSVT